MMGIGTAAFFEALESGDARAARIASLCARSGVTLLREAPRGGRFAIGETLAVREVCGLATLGDRPALRALRAFVAARCAPIAPIFLRAAAVALTENPGIGEAALTLAAFEARRAARTGAGPPSATRLAARFSAKREADMVEVLERVGAAEAALTARRIAEMEDAAEFAGFGLRRALDLTLAEDAALRWLWIRESATDDELRRALNPGGFVSGSKIVEVVVHRLRRKLAEIGGAIDLRWDGSYALSAATRDVLWGLKGRGK